MKRPLAALLFAVFFISFGPGAPSLHQASAQIPPVEGKTGKLSLRINKMQQLAATNQLAPDVASQSAQLALPKDGPGSLRYFNGGLVTEIRVSDTSPATLAAMQAEGATVVSVHEPTRMVTAAVPPDRLSTVASVPQVLNIQEALTPLVASQERALTAPAAPMASCLPGALISEADTQLGAATARTTYAVDGTGVKVAVISDSYSNLSAAPTAATDVSNDELPGTTNPCGNTTPVNVVRDMASGGIDEGRAMLQAVYDLAPKAGLMFTNTLSESDMATQFTALATAGAHIISDDLSYLTEPFFQEGPIGTAARTNFNNGVLHTTSAGNSRSTLSGSEWNGYETSAFRPVACPANIPAGINNCHNFNTTGTDATYGFTLSPSSASFTSSVMVVLQWNEPRGGVTTDLDFFVMSGGALITSSTNGNPGGGTQQAFEFIQVQNNSTTNSANVDLVVGRWSVAPANASGTPRFKMWYVRTNAVTGIERASVSSPDSTGPLIMGHACDPNTLTLAATAYNDGVNPEPYTSPGPCTWYWNPVPSTTALAFTQSITKPEFAATDCAQNSFFGSGTPRRFCGTSQSSPHAAAVAALMKHRAPTANVATLRSAMFTSPTAMNGTANQRGVGRLNAVAAVGALAIAPTITSPTATGITSGGATLGGNVTSDGGATITERGVVLARTSQDLTPTIGESFVQQVFGTGTTGVFTVSSPALNANTQYSYSAYAKNSQGTSYTSPATFTTSAGVSAPTITSPTATAITSSGATLGGNVTSDGGATVTERGVVLARTSQDSTPTIGESFVQQVIGSGTTGVFAVSSPALIANTQYSYSAYAKNSQGTSYTTPTTFTTSAGATVPTVINPSQTSITQTSALLGGTVQADGGSAVTSRGIAYSSSNNDPDIGESGVLTSVEGGTGTGVFTKSVGGLSPNTTYYFKAYATNSVGTGYTFMGAFTTNAPPVSAPTIAKVFGAPSVPLNGTTTLAIGLFNSNASALSGVAFTDNLPSGLVVATPNGLTGSCGGGATITATAGTGVVSLSGGSLPANTGCTITVNVLATSLGVKSNVTGNVTSTQSGAGGTANANVTVVQNLLSTIGIFRNGLWYLNNQNDGSVYEFAFNFGASTDIAVAGDWDCSGSVTPGVFRDGAFYLSNAKNGTGPHRSFFYGAAGDTPVVGDWNGDGCDSVGIFRAGWFFMTNATTGSPGVNYSFFYGATSGDKPVSGDWDGNGSDSVGIVRNGVWYLTNAITGSPAPNYSFAFGIGSDIPVTGDWDGNGTRGVGIFRNGVWYLTNAITGSPQVQITAFFGATGDKPVTGAWGASSASATVEPAQAMAVPSCAHTLSCKPGPNDWTGPVGGLPPAPQGAWTAPPTPPPAGWTGIGEPLPIPTGGVNKLDGPPPATQGSLGPSWQNPLAVRP